MFRLITFIFVSCVLALLFQNSAYYEEPYIGEKNGWKGVNGSGIFYVILVIYWIIFAGTRTQYNDTWAYMKGFMYDAGIGIDGISQIQWTLGENPGFWIYQVIIKTVFGSNANIFLLITAAIVYCSFLKFYKRYSSDFSLTVYIFITSTAFFFTLGAMKQIIAMAIGVWALPCALEKKWIKFGILIAIAMLFHPYVILFVCIPFICDRVWNLKTFLIIFATIVVGYSFQAVLGTVMEVTSSIGDDYSQVYLESEAVNIFRLAVYLVPVVLSFFVRHEINEDNNVFYLSCINLSLISAMFMLLASFGGAVFMGRVSNYFLPFTMISIPYIIQQYPVSVAKTLKYLCVICYGLFWLYYYRSIPWNYDMLGHISVFRIF